MSTSEIDSLVARLMRCHASKELLSPPSAGSSDFDSPTAYQVLRAISAKRHAAGGRNVGRKIGFSNRSIWARYGVTEPIWAPLWSDTVLLATDNSAALALGKLSQPRIEPEVVFKLSASVPPTHDAEAVLRAVEWFAPGFEVVQCHYPDWKFSAPDSIADFGLHGALVVGTPVSVVEKHPRAVAATLATFEATLFCGTAAIDRGGGALVLGSPLLALAHLSRELEVSGHPPLAPGEIITTGTLTNAWPISPGERWSADYGTLGSQRLTVTFE